MTMEGGGAHRGEDPTCAGVVRESFREERELEQEPDSCGLGRTFWEALETWRQAY
jgi:hypothetical protein